MTDASDKATMLEDGPRPDIAVFIPSYVGGGAERLAFFIAESLAAAGYRVDLVVARGHGELKTAPLDHVRKVELGAITEVLALPAWLSYVRRVRPRVVLAMVHTATFTAGLARKLVPSVPVIIAVQRVLKRKPRDMWWVHRAFGFGIERRLYADCERVITVSKGLARECEDVFALAPGSVEAIYNPLFGRADDAAGIEDSDEKLFEKPVILGAGRLVDVKNFNGLIEAFAAVTSDHEAHLLIIGEGPARSALEALAMRLGVADRVFLLGWRADPRAYMARSQVFVSASLSEGFGLVCLEALASGCALVVADCPHGPREIVDHGRFGALVPPGEPQALSDAMDAALATPPPQSDCEERASWLAMFRPETISERYRMLIAGVIGAPPSR